MDIIPHIICSQKISGALETESFGQNVGQAGTTDCENSVEKQNSSIFLLHPLWNLLHSKYGPRWKSHKSVPLLAWEKPELNSSWNSQLLGLIHNDAYVLRHSFHLWEPGISYEGFTQRLTLTEMVGLVLFLFLRRNFLNCSYQLVIISQVHTEKLIFCLAALYLSCENSEFGISSSDHPLTMSPSHHIAFNKL